MQVNFLLFDRLTQLDLTGPFEVFASVPELRVALVAKTLDLVRSDRGLGIMPSHAFDTAPAPDILVVPGGPGVDALVNDDQVLAYVRQAAAAATYVTSVCTGALVLAAAGLLLGRRAATHWNAREFLADFGVTVVPERVVVDLPYITGGGVTAGIDFALTLVAQIFGAEQGRLVQLGLEYDPYPPFDAGSPEKAGPETVRACRDNAAAAMAKRRSAVQRALAGRSIK